MSASTTRRQPSDAPIRWIDAWVRDGLAAGAGPLDLVGACARVLAQDTGLARSAPLDAFPLLRFGDDLCLPDDAQPDPWTLGLVYERALDRRHRRRHGVHYTPVAVAARLVDLALPPGDSAVTVCDPSVGGGAFLLAAAEALAARGHPPDRVVGELLWGIDIDPGAINVTRTALALWAAGITGEWPPEQGHLVCADTLVAGKDAFVPPRQFDVVVGNPPFQNQLETATAVGRDRVRRIRERWDVDTGPYADPSAFFLLAGLELAGTSGTVMLLQPRSVLGVDGLVSIRRRLADSLAGIWVTDHDHFEATVRVCAIKLAAAGAAGPVRRWRDGDQLDPWHADPPEATWSPLLAEVDGVPRVRVGPGRRLGELAGATAGFRDEYYGLRDHTVELAAPGGGRLRGGLPEHLAPLVTVGMIDPLRNRWGTEAFRYAKRSWQRPCVDLDSLEQADPGLAAWVRERLVPKVLVATQTKVIEVIVDEAGELVPSTPTIAVTAPRHRLWDIAAALSSPIAAAVASSKHAGTALAPQAIKVSAAQVLELPVPADGRSWRRGAAAARAAAGASDPREWAHQLHRLGDAMCAAYGVDDPEALLGWWRARLPPWR